VKLLDSWPPAPRHGYCFDGDGLARFDRDTNPSMFKGTADVTDRGCGIWLGGGTDAGR
jgi:hypothetical protein